MRARDAAAENGFPYGTILTTTAGRQNTPEGAYAYKEYNNGLRWDEKFLDCDNINELKEILRKNSKNDIMVIDLNHRQLGYTDEWLRGKLKESGAVGLDAEADYLNRWVKGTDASPITPELLEMIGDSSAIPSYTEIGRQGYVLRWYKSEGWLSLNKDRELIMGLDTSDAVGKDGIGLVITDVRTGEVVAAGDYNETNVINFSNWLVDLLIKYPKLTIIVERRSTGTAILDNMMLMLEAKGIDPFRRMFNWVVNNASHSEKAAKAYEEINKSFNSIKPYTLEKNRKFFGFATSGTGVTSRTGLYGITLQNAAKFTGSTVRDKKLIAQLSNLTVRNGRIDHASGGHDDLVIAWLLCHWFLTDGDTREHYGIENGTALTQLIVENANIKDNVDNRARHEKNVKLKEELDKILLELKKTRNNLDIIKLSTRATMINRKLDTLGIETLDLDTVLAEIKRERNSSKKYYLNRR